MTDNIWGENECFLTTDDGDDDQDWFVVQVAESGTLNTTVTAVPNNLNLNLEILVIENNQAKLIADDDDNFAAGGQSLNATAFVNPGTYYIHIEDDGHNNTNEEPYSFCVSFTPNPFEVNQTLELSALIPLDTCIMERIWGENECFLTTDDGDNDQDWYRVEIGSNCQLSIALTDSPSALDLNMELYRIDNGEVVLVADDGDTNSTAGQELFIDLDVPQGIYYIPVSYTHLTLPTIYSV